MNEALKEEDDTLFAYIDETWAYPGMRHSYGWVDLHAEKDPLKYILEGLCVSPLPYLSP